MGINERALHWAYHFGRLGAQVLARWGDWEGATRWTQEALTLYREAYREGWNQEPGGEPWNILLIHYLNGLLQLGEREKAADVLKQLQKEDFGPQTAAWRLRLRVRKARLRMLSEKIQPGTLRRIADRIAFDADAWLGGVRSDLAWHTLAEICLLRGGIAARCGQAAEAEAYWWEACNWIALLIPFGDDYGFDEWTLEEVAARVAFWRAEHGMGREAARAGEAWVALRRYLGEAVSQPLVDIAMWGLAGGDGRPWSGRCRNWNGKGTRKPGRPAGPCGDSCRPAAGRRQRPSPFSGRRWNGFAPPRAGSRRRTSWRRPSGQWRRGGRCPRSSRRGQRRMRCPATGPASPR